MTAPVDPTRFDKAYRDDRTVHGLPAATPWDIGSPQLVVQQLVNQDVINRSLNKVAPFDGKLM